MIAYFIQVSCCWLIFHVIYRAFLRKETFFSINRVYLVSTLCLGLILPALRLLALELVSTPELVKVYIAPITTGMAVVEQVTQNMPSTNDYQLTDYIFGIYLLGVIVLFMKFLTGLYQIYRLYKTGVSEFINGLRLVRTNKVHLPFSFWNTIFLSKEMELSESDFKKIIQHEEGHIRERHSLDVLLIEILSILFWCSPPIWLYKTSLKEIHEYLADAYVLTTTATKQYGHLLLRQVQPGLQVALANHFFQSQLKNRISMMTKTKSSNWRRWKYGIGISAVALLLMAFSMKVTTLQELVERTGKTSFNWRTSELLGSDFDESKVRTVLERKFKGQNRAYYVDKDGIRTELVGDTFHTSTQIAQLHGVYRDVLHIYPDHHNEINEITTQLFADYGLNARIEANTIIYTNENEIDGKEQSFESNTAHILQLQKGSDSMVFHDGKRYDGVFADLDKEKMSYFAALSKEEALDKYGESGEDGAVDVFSKTEQEIIEAEIQELTDEFRNLQHEISPSDLTDPVQLAAAGNPLILIDGEKYDKPFSTVDMKNYEFMSVYIPCEDTIKEYGEDAKDGVIEIFIKKQRVFSPKHFEKELTRLAIEYNKSTKKQDKQVVYQEVLGLWKYIGQFIPKHQKEITLICIEVMNEVELFPFGLDMNNDTEVKGIYELKPTVAELFIVTEEMPRFPGCEDKENKANREQCAQYEMLQFIYGNINYPKETKATGIEGMVVVRFVVDVDGSIVDPEIIRALDEHTSEEVLRVVNLMPRWIPGKQSGEIVKVKYHLPVKFKLEDNEKPQEAKLSDKSLEVEHFKLYPNPVADILNIELKTKSNEKTNFQIIDSSGKNWKSSTLDNTDKMTNTTFDMTELPSGMYYLTIIQGSRKTTQSFIKE